MPREMVLMNARFAGLGGLGRRAFHFFGERAGGWGGGDPRFVLGDKWECTCVNCALSAVDPKAGGGGSFC